MNYPLSKYRFYEAGNKTIAVSTYAGKPVRGVSICHENDNFNLETGKLLAAARCNEKVSAKRVARANMKVKQAQADLERAQKHLADMKQYLNDAVIAYNDAGIATDKIIESLRVK
jgi:hypothetical protein